MPVKTRLEELGLALKTKATELDGLAAEWKVEDGGQLVISQEKYDLYKKTLSEAQEIKTLMQAEQVRDGLITFLDAPADQTVAGQDATAVAHEQRREVKSLGEYFTDSEEFKAGRGMSNPYIQVKVDKSITGLGYKDVFNASGGTITIPGLGGTERLPMVERQLRQTHVRDLFPRATTTAALLYGVRETGWTNAAKQVHQRTQPDGSAAKGDNTDVYGLKPKSQITLTPVIYPVATIAHTLDAHKLILDDEPRLQDFLNRRMVDGVMYAEDDALLFGVGGGEEITGIFNTPGIQSYTGLATDPYTVQIRKAATRVALAEYQATGVVLSPLDWETIELETDNTGAFRVAVSVALGAETRVWRMQVVETTAMPQNRFLCGAFGLGSQFYDREAVQVTVSTENRDNFERNVITFRGEERAAFEVSRPEAHVAGTLTPAA